MLFVSTTPAYFIHFTTLTDAAAMVAAGIIGLSRTIAGAVYAAPVGGSLVPGVQYAQAGREVAILFTAPYAPEVICPEEVIWHRTSPLPVTDAIIIDAADADALLDGSAGIPEDGIWHPARCVCKGCITARGTLAA